MNLLIVSTKELEQKALSVLEKSDWRIVVPSLYSEIWRGSGDDVSLSLIKQYVPRFQGIYIEEGMKLESVALLNHAIESLMIKEYVLCDFDSIDDIQGSISNGIKIDENHANAKLAEQAINNMFIHRLSKAIKSSVIDERIKAHRLNFRNTTSDEISRLSKQWYKQLQSFYVLLPTIAGLYWIIKAERTISVFNPEKLHRIYVQYQKDGIEFTVPYGKVYSEEYLQELNDSIEHLRNPANTHRVRAYQKEVRDIKPQYRPIILSFLQSKMFYLNHFPIEYTTKLTRRLYQAGLITDPSTKSLAVPTETSIAFIRYLNYKYGDEYVMQEIRSTEDHDGISSAILPIFVDEAHDPENIEHTVGFQKIRFDNQKMKEDAITIYSFIFVITEWWHMKDAIYDTSLLQIEANNKIFDVKANKLAEVFDPEKGKNVEQKNWRSVNVDLLNALSSEEETSFMTHETILPECSFNEVLVPRSVESSEIHSKRPPRYGVGRFNTQILGGKNIGTADNFHIIQNNLVSGGLVSLVETIMHPQEIAKETVAWCEKNAPTLLDEKTVHEYQNRLDSIRYHGEDPLGLVKEFEFMLDEIIKEAGIHESGGHLTEAMVKLAKTVAIKKGIKIDDPETFFGNYSLVKNMIDVHGIEEQSTLIKLFKCPICRQGYVFEKEFVNTNSGEVSPYYACEHNGCFQMYDNKIDEFFTNKGQAMSKTERLEAIKAISSKQHLKSNGYMFHDFIGSNKKPYDAKVFIEPYFDKKNTVRYSLKLRFKGAK